MNIKRTIPIILETSPDISATVKEFNRYQRTISPIAFNAGKPLGAIELQRIVYHQIPTTLSSQLRCSAIRLTTAAYSAAKSNRRAIRKPFLFKRPRALFLIGKAGRDASFRKDSTLSIWTVNGRKRINYRIPERFQRDLSKAKPVDCLVIRDNGKATLCLTLEVPDPKGTIPVGIDLGVNNALVASTKKATLVVSGKQLAIRNKRTRKVRSRLQSKLAGKKAQRTDTKSVRGTLKRLSRKTRNRNKTFCRQTAATLCKWAPADAVLVFEDLKIPRSRKKQHLRKGARRKLNSWFYRLMLQSVKNRAERAGLAIGFVDPAYTSQLCSSCGLLGERKRSKFSCPHCGYVAHADVNASLNILFRFAVLRSSGPS